MFLSTSKSPMRRTRRRLPFKSPSCRRVRVSPRSTGPRSLDLSPTLCLGPSSLLLLDDHRAPPRSERNNHLCWSSSPTLSPRQRNLTIPTSLSSTHLLRASNEPPAPPLPKTKSTPTLRSTLLAPSRRCSARRTSSPTRSTRQARKKKCPLLLVDPQPHLRSAGGAAEVRVGSSALVGLGAHPASLTFPLRSDETSSLYRPLQTSQSRFRVNVEKSSHRLLPPMAPSMAPRTAPLRPRPTRPDRPPARPLTPSATWAALASPSAIVVGGCGDRSSGRGVPPDSAGDTRDQ